MAKPPNKPNKPTGKKTPLEEAHALGFKPLDSDHALYKSGYVIGGKRLGDVVPKKRDRQRARRTRLPESERPAVLPRIDQSNVEEKVMIKVVVEKGDQVIDEVELASAEEASRFIVETTKRLEESKRDSEEETDQVK